MITAQSNISVFGVCPRAWLVERALNMLRFSGFRNSDVSVVFAGEPGPRGAALPVAGIGGSMLGWLCGIGALSIPETGKLIAAGPIMGILGGVDSQVIHHGLAAALVSMGVAEQEAGSYEQQMRNGGVLLAIQCENEHWFHRACAVLVEHGAESISTNAGLALPDSMPQPEMESMGAGICRS